ncbi:dTDP-4-dehydrorhamnose 3,5-epimerase [Pseudalgibacter alginicilyticus]|uniref:dTDP-4-dehydrorhamnose 3,5-epimerase n=1 Tax=Pseudalgibacter alginicilyticus TaxID=1736674 RepID=A0A0P0CY91_9FLAO|nr:dTDP-4-dehydrorhamnose 3,5-epimerase [Pseudalgibacter alginicilyticus]ALJ05585.1 dTDP-4-dehydrorhamnose 3,5-epimerase [Pseudalgibacter alginicilyticus]
MLVEETHLKGCFVITPKVFEDERGFFFESFNTQSFESKTGVKVNFVQDNISKSSKGVLRGLHFQKDAFAQAKLVQVIKGKVLDVCVDLRKESSTFGHYFSILLDDLNKQQLYVPRGFAHGFLVLEDDTIFSYKCDNYYNKAAESGILYNDEKLNIDWGLMQDAFVISEKDKCLSTFEDFLNE